MRTQHGLIAAGLAAATLLATAGVVEARQAVTMSDVNLRSGPNATYPIITGLAAGEYVDVTGCRGNWCAVTAPYAEGWVSASYLTAPPRQPAAVGYTYEMSGPPGIIIIPAHATGVRPAHIYDQGVEDGYAYGYGDGFVDGYDAGYSDATCDAYSAWRC